MVSGTKKSNKLIDRSTEKKPYLYYYRVFSWFGLVIALNHLKYLF